VTEQRDEPLARQGYWRVGGPMDRFVVVDSAAELAEVRRGPGPLHVLGNGSNLLVPDEGLRGTTIRLGAGFRTVELLPGDRVRVGAGLLNVVLLQRLARLGLAGLGCLAGVPGTVGGAVAMNAGTALGEIGGRLVSVEGVGDGPTILRREDLPMAYREGGLPEGFIVTAVVLQLHHDPGEAEAIAAHLARRRATQPLDLPSCGSVFRNPPGDHAGRLIEAVGLKGHRIGDAAISERHANFIVNLGSATAADVMACIRLAHARVLAETGVRLEPEVRVLGAWPDWPLPQSPAEAAR
jgi:UDP-N-acetylmuramate dehydrogenase